MADILIKGLTLPKKGEAILAFVFPSGRVDYKYDAEMETHRTTAIELPPHGDLIDRDKIKLKKDPVLNWYVVGELLKEMPVIVEASNGNNN